MSFSAEFDLKRQKSFFCGPTTKVLTPLSSHEFSGHIFTRIYFFFPPPLLVVRPLKNVAVYSAFRHPWLRRRRRGRAEETGQRDWRDDFTGYSLSLSLCNRTHFLWRHSGRRFRGSLTYKSWAVKYSLQFVTTNSGSWANHHDILQINFSRFFSLNLMIWVKLNFNHFARVISLVIKSSKCMIFPSDDWSDVYKRL